MKYALVFLVIIALPFLTAIVLTAIPFVTLYAVFQLFKKQPIAEKKNENSFFSFVAQNLNKNENIFKRNITVNKP
ncbi:hypothetical protein [Flavobacterium microcysteis]|uniref:hypothetical protein n=1 Tax=Flavobacterium microcysteis TaxID=2596891 RepID=UPI0013157DDA|nr:hypothetical protein [Flavobacterium microcysteis]